MGADPVTAGLLIGGSLLSSKQQSKASKRASSAVSESSNASIAAQERALERQLGITQPFRLAGQQAINPLLEALGIQQISQQIAQPQLFPGTTQPVLPPGVAAGQPAGTPGQTAPGQTAPDNAAQEIAAIEALLATRDFRGGRQRKGAGIADRFSRNVLKNFGLDRPGSVSVADLEADLERLRQPVATQQQIPFGAPASVLGPVPTAEPAVSGQMMPIQQGIIQPQTREITPTAAQPSQEITLPGAEILENPLLKSIQDDVTNRLFANRAARGILGSGGTANELFTSLAPTALNLGLSLQSVREAQKQQRIQNLFNLLGLGGNVAAGQGTAIQQTGQGVAGALQQAGAAQAAGALGRGQAISQGIGDIAGLGLLSAGGFFNRFNAPQNGFVAEPGGGFRPTIGGTQVAGPLTGTGGF